MLSQEVGGETVLLDLNSETYFGLDEIGTRIWQLIQEHRDLEKIFDIMLAEYNVDEKQLEKDLNELITKLVKDGIIRIR